MRSYHFNENDYPVVCDLIGVRFNRSECRKTWDGLLVHKSVWNPRQPQDTPRIIPIAKLPKDLRPGTTDLHDQTINISDLVIR